MHKNAQIKNNTATHKQTARATINDEINSNRTMTLERTAAKVTLGRKSTLLA